MSAVPGLFLPAARRAPPLYSVPLAQQRSLTLQRQPSAVSALIRTSDIPMHEVAANTVVLRFVPYPPSFPLNYAGVMSVPPDIQTSGVGGFSRNNRFTGARPDGSLGLNGSYWGLPDGVAAEDLYYSCLKGWDGSGPMRLLARTTPMAVQWQRGLLGYGVDAEIPEQLVFSGNCCTDVVVARTIRNISSVNLNLGDPLVHQSLDAVNSRWRPLLDSLQYNSIQEGIADPYFPEFARAIAHAAAEKYNPDAIWAQSARVEAASGLTGFDPSAASNLVLVGEGRTTLTDRLVGLGVIQIRSDAAGVSASVEPIHGKGARFDDGVERSLVPVAKTSE
ncbi:hypothetical protein [Roseateles sp.]|uniref:hypothetical protein n=1 Tax=Roseateles sp. TaxID=1971397 RepID=UPI003267A4A2